MVTLDEGGWAARAARLEHPPGDLAALVEHIFTVDFRRAEQDAWKILPDTCGHVIVKLGGEEGARPRSVTVVGARSEAVTTDVSGRSWTVGVRLRPGALPVLVGASADRFTDRSEPAGAIWGSAGDGLVGAVAGADDPDHVKSRLIGFLRRIRPSASAVDWRAAAFAKLARRSGGRMAVGAAARAIGISPRALRDTTHDALGLAPKRYARVERLLGALHASHEEPWGRVAVRMGFSDQAHLARDFKDLLGETPSDFGARGRRVPIRSRRGPRSAPP